MSVNKVILVGNLGRDPELRHTPGGSAVLNFTMATNEVWTDREGQRQQRTEWHRIIVWGRQAETLNEYLRKGRQVYVEGRLQTRQWTDAQNQQRQTTEIVSQRIVLLGSRGEVAGGAPSEEGPRPAAATADVAPDTDAPNDGGSGFGSDEDDDLPF
jgi:single-strand DNA-binding protein